jgi:hypothetical protein
MALPKITADMKKLGQEMLFPMLAFITAQNKIKGAFEAIGAVVLQKVLGPLGNWLGAIVAINRGINSIAKAWKEAGMQAAAAQESTNTRMKLFLRNLEAAKQRTIEITKLSGKGVFSKEQWESANAVLQKMGGSMIAAGNGLTRVGDAAAASGSGLVESAEAIGALYSAIANGQPIEAATNQLAQMGIISSGAARKLQDLQASGVASSEVWKAAASSLERNNGAMTEMSNTLNALNASVEHHREVMESAFSSSFVEGEKIGAESLIKTYERLTPTVKKLGEEMAILPNAMARVKASIMDFVTGSAAFNSAMAFAARMASLFFSAMSVTGITAVVVIVGKLVLILPQLAKNYWMVAYAAKAFATGNFAASLSLLKMAGTGGTLKNALSLLLIPLNLVKVLIKEIIALAIGTPLGILITLIAATTAAWGYYRNEAESARKAIVDLNAAQEQANKLMREQLDNIRTADDVMKLYAQTQKELKDALNELSAAEEAYNKKGGGKEETQRLKVAQGRAERAKEVDEGARRIGTIMKDMVEAPEGLDLSGDILRRKFAAADAAKELELAKMSPEARLFALNKTAQSATEEHEQGQARIKNRQDALLTANALTPAERIASLTEMAQNNPDEIARLKAQRQLMEGDNLGPGSEGTALQKQDLDSKIKALEEREASAPDRAKSATDAAKAQAQENELRNRMALLDIDRARNTLLQEGITKQLEQLKVERAQIEARKDLTNKEREAALAQNNAQQELLKREQGFKNRYARLDIDSAALELMDDGLAKTLKQINTDRERLKVKRDQNEMSKEESDAEEANLNAAEGLARKKADLLQKQAAFQTQANRAGLEERSALLRGDYDEAKKAQSRRLEAEDQMHLNDLKIEARNLFEDESKQQEYINGRMKEYIGLRESERAQARQDTRASNNINFLTDAAELAKRAGKSKLSRQLTREAGAVQDEMNERKTKADLVEQGMGEAEANKIAGAQTRKSQILREADLLGSVTPPAVVSSLQKIGGGGNVAEGAGGIEGRLDKMVNLLQQLNALTRDTTGNPYVE